MAVERLLKRTDPLVSNPVGRRYIPVFVLVAASLLAFFDTFLTSVYGAGPAIVIYRVGNAGGNEAMSIKLALESKGFPVTLVQGESIIEKHVDKVGVINQSSAKLFLAFEYVPSEKSRAVVVAKTAAKKGEGSFLTIDEVPASFAEESNGLAYAVAESFGVKVKQMPLFPLLGVNMPGVFLRWETKEDAVPDLTNRLCAGLEKYIRKDKSQ
jgi:hypothetical protein